MRVRLMCVLDWTGRGGQHALTWAVLSPAPKHRWPSSCRTLHRGCAPSRRPPSRIRWCVSERWRRMHHAPASHFLLTRTCASLPRPYQSGLPLYFPGVLAALLPAADQSCRRQGAGAGASSTDPALGRGGRRADGRALGPPLLQGQRHHVPLCGDRRRKQGRRACDPVPARLPRGMVRPTRCWDLPGNAPWQGLALRVSMFQ